VETIEVDYGNGSNFEKADGKDWNMLQYSAQYYEDNQSEANPFYIVAGRTVVLFPTPSKNVS